jgi:hypothetical protein
MSFSNAQAMILTVILTRWVVKGRAIDRGEFGVWVYGMIKPSEMRKRMVVQRWSMMWSLDQFRVVEFGIFLQERGY